MKISSKTHYGIQVLCSLVTSEKPLSVSELCRHTGVGKKYLEKVMKILSDVKAVKSIRGVNGGYSLFKSPKEIFLGEPIRALEEDDMEIIDCVNKTGCCCSSAKLWKKLFDKINDVLDGITLQDLIEGNL